MRSARFCFVPLKDIAPAAQQAQLAAKDDAHVSDLLTLFSVPSKLNGEGIRAGHVLALHDGDSVTALARLLALDTSNLHWRRLPMLEAPELSATPELREVTSSEAQRFILGRAFGERVALLEPDKRLGDPNELRVQLPSSKDCFDLAAAAPVEATA